MDPRKRETEQLEAEIARAEQQIANECISVGKQISELDHTETRSAELNKYLHSVRTLRKSEDDFRNDISRIRDTVRKIQELETSIAENDRRSRQIAKEREAKYVELGAGAYTVFKNISDRDRYRPFFEEILKLDLEIERFEGDLKALEQEKKDKGILDKIRYKGREFVVRGSISKIEKQKMKAFADAGAKVADSEFGQRTAGELRLLFDFAAERKRAMDDLLQEAKRLREEIEGHKGTLKQYGIDGKPDGRCDELEKRIGDVRRELEVMYSWMGQLFIDKDLRNELAHSQLSAKYEIISAMRQNIARKRGQISRLKAELEIEELQKKEKQLRQRRKQLEEELKVKERQIAVVDLEIHAGQRRIDDLKRVITGEAPYTDAPPLPPTPDFYGGRGPT
ncbi:MAG: hypothetical protein HYY16_08015 [Planctomycetes bacterium]|nr:hypothetical protein [Planctomycetota bacterium]